ncbi:MAG: DUF3833 domain-containing protein [Bdellovibrionales bacterium]
MSYFMSLIILVFSLVGCSSVQVSDYKNEKPELKLEEFFNGPLTAHGVFIDRSGMVKKRFTVDMKGSWKENVGVLEEDFFYSDGTKSRRVWTLTKQPNGTYTGEASDVVGKALGEVSGNAFRFAYTLALEVDGTTYNVKLDDWMWQIDDKVILNKSKMYKFGIYLGEVLLTMSKK